MVEIPAEVGFPTDRGRRVRAQDDVDDFGRTLQVDIPDTNPDQFDAVDLVGRNPVEDRRRRILLRARSAVIDKDIAGSATEAALLTAIVERESRYPIDHVEGRIWLIPGEKLRLVSDDAGLARLPRRCSRGVSRLLGKDRRG